MSKSGDTLPATNMETQKGPDKDYSPSKRVLHGFPCEFGVVYLLASRYNSTHRSHECVEFLFNLDINMYCSFHFAA